MSEARLSIIQASKLLRCRHQLIREAIRRGDVPGYYQDPYSTASRPRLLVKVSEVEAFLERAVYRWDRPDGSPR